MLAAIIPICAVFISYLLKCQYPMLGLRPETRREED